jgi:ribosomal protein S18 acetylase RimI-like enzyme
MEIRQLRSDELERFRALRLRALRDAPAAFGTTFEDARGWSPERWSALFSSLLAFVATTGDDDVGMVRTALDPQVARAGRLGSLWVAPEARGAGVGSALVETAIAWARREGLDAILLDVSDENVAAIRLYDTLGFAPTGTRSSFPIPREHLGKHQRRLSL